MSFVWSPLPSSAPLLGVPIIGDLSVTQGANTLVADGLVQTPNVGVLSATQGANTLSATGTVADVVNPLSHRIRGSTTQRPGTLAASISASLTQSPVGGSLEAP